MKSRFKTGLTLAVGLAITLSTAATTSASPGAFEESDTAVALGVPLGGTGYTAIVPARLLDTRRGYSTIDGRSTGSGAIAAGRSVNVQITGRGGVPPTGVDSVVLNVTAVNQTAQTFLTVHPTGTTRPKTANLSPIPGMVTPNMVVAKVSPSGSVTIFNDSGTVDVVIDVHGWFPLGSPYKSVNSTRIMDTRPNGATADNIAEAGGRLGAGQTVDLLVAGRGGTPLSGVDTVVLNVTPVQPTAPTFITVYPTGTARPATANLTPTPGMTTSNVVIVKVGAGGKVRFHNNAGSVHLVVDIQGWLPVSRAFTPMNPPKRLLDTRRTGVTVDGIGQARGVIGPRGTLDLKVAGRGGVPASGVGAVALNIAVTNPSARTFVSAYPTGAVRPTAAVLNTQPGLTMSNLVVAKVGPTGEVRFYNNGGSIHLIADVVGWFPSDVLTVDDAATVAEDAKATTLNVLANDIDADGGSVTIASVTQPANGTVTMVGGAVGARTAVTYRPAANFCGSDSFTYTANGGSNATVTITVTCVDDLPVANDDAATVTEDSAATTLQVRSNDSDIDGGPKAIQTVSTPANGSAAVINGGAELTYEPAADFCGSDSFTYTLNGGDSATVSMSVTCINDAPSFVPGADQLAAPGSGPQSVSNWATAISPGPANESLQAITFQVTNDNNALFSAQPTVSSAGTLAFATAIGASGAATVTVTAKDSGGTASGGADLSAAETFTITVESLPVAAGQSETTNEETAVVITLSATDDQGDALTFAIGTGPTKGTLGTIGTPSCAGVPSMCTATVTYTPGIDNIGADSFTFTANDGTNTSAAATVAITITAVDDSPVAVADFATVSEDAAASAITVTANDTDVDAGPLTITGVTQPAGGTVSIHADLDKVVFTPAANFCNNPPGTALTTFTYTLNGGSTATVTVTVDCVDDPSTAVDDAATVAEDAGATAVNVFDNDTDIEGDTPTITSVTQPTNGTVVITGGGTGLTYAPNANYCNTPPGTTPDTFTYTIVGASTATVTMTVTCVDDAPLAVADEAATTEDAAAAAIPVLANDTDIDGGPVTIGSVTQPTNGVVVITGGGTGLTYAPNANYCNTPPGTTADTFTYSLGASTTTVSVTVNCVNDAPLAGADSFTGTSRAVGNTALVVNSPADAAPDPAGPQKTVSANVLTNDSDPDGPGPLVVVAGTVATADGGSVVIEADGDFTYHPAVGTSCTDTSDSFIYTVSDQATPTPATHTATISITIADCVWYVDGAGPAGNGSSAAPLNALTSLNGAGGAGDLDAAAATIFVYDGVYAGGLALEASQLVFAQRHGLTVGDGGAGTVTLEPAGGADSTIDGGVTLGSGNTIQGLHFGAATGPSLTGTAFGTATINTVTSGSINNTTGGAVDLATGTINAAFTSTSSAAGTYGIRLNATQGTFVGGTGTLANATDTDVVLQGGAANFTYDGTITDDLGALVLVTAQTGGASTFNGAITDLGNGTGNGITLTNNAATVSTRFNGGLTLSTGANAAFAATNAGVVQITDPAGAAANTIATTTGTPINVVSTSIGAAGLTLQSVTTTGAASGIVLNSTGPTGFFHVTGAGGSCTSAASCTGGSIQNTTGVGVLLNSATDITLDSVYIANTANHAVQATSLSDGAGSANPTFSLLRSQVVSPGDADNENALAFGTDTVVGNNTGRIVITDTVITQYEEQGLSVHNDSGTLTVEITGTPTGVATSTTRFSDNHDAHGQSGILALAAGTASITLDVNGVMFDQIETEAVMAQARAVNSVITARLRNNISINGGGPDNFPAGGGFALVSDVGGDLAFNIAGNNIRDVSGDGVVIIADGPTQGAIDNNVISSTGLGDGIRIDTEQLDGGLGANNFTATIAIRNNQIGVDSTFPGIGDDGIQVLHRDGTKTLNLTITGNSIGNTSVVNGGETIRYFQDADISNGQGLTYANVLVSNNTLTNSGNADALAFILRDTADADVNITGNTVSGANLNILLDQAGTSVLQLAQASVAAMAAANTASTTTTVGTITFNSAVGNPPLPVLP